jgi:hypothetical protein
MKTITTHYIDGRFTESHGSETLDLIDPTNKQIIGRVTLGDEKDARRAIRAAKEAFRSFSTTTVERRARYLQQFHDAFAARADEHAAIMVKEYGAPINSARRPPIVRRKAFYMPRRPSAKCRSKPRSGQPPYRWSLSAWPGSLRRGMPTPLLFAQK